MATHRPASGTAYRNGRFAASTRELAEEAAVSISYNGTSHAVLMATPADLVDLATGFSLSEGVVASVAEIEAAEAVDCDLGIDMQLRLAGGAGARLAERRRTMAGPVGCGLCGIESLEEAMREIAPVSADMRMAPGDVARAVAAMAKAQALNLRTRAVHAAGFYRPERGLELLREDVGRHNALDKLVGAAARAGIDMAQGAVVLSSRLSIELVQKTAAAGCGILVAVSAPTALAVATAGAAGITLAAVARGDEFELFTHPQRIIGGSLQDVA
jgi:FdhD protein